MEALVFLLCVETQPVFAIDLVVGDLEAIFTQTRFSRLQASSPSSGSTENNLASSGMKSGTCLLEGGGEKEFELGRLFRVKRGALEMTWPF